MAVESAPVSGSQTNPGVMDKGLKAGAIGYISNIVIGVASTAPAYSLAVTLGFIVAVQGVGVHAPAVLLVAFLPMLLISAAYKYLNRADPDAGTTFAWTTRAFGPTTGWVNGWAIFLADIIVMASLSDVAAIYTFKLFGFSELGNSNGAIVVAAIIWIALMTWICYRGIELSARIQQFLLGAEVLILTVFAVVAFIKVGGGHQHLTATVVSEATGKSEVVHYSSLTPSLEWINPFTMPFHGLVVAMLLAVFIYWGWDSGVAVNEESEDPAEGPGKAAVISTIMLVVIYVIVSAGAQAFYGTSFLENNASDVLSALGAPVLGGVLYKLLIIAVLTSASASTQTTILPTARTTLSMAHWKAVTALLARVHKRYMTPTVSTLGFGLLSIIITVPLLLLSNSVLESVTVSIGFPICFYYGFTGFACAVFYRRELLSSVRHFLLLGLLPVIGGVILFAVGGYAITYYAKAANVETAPIAGITLPLWLGIGGLIVGLILAVVSRPFFKEFFARRPEVAIPGLLDQPPPTGPVPERVDF